MLKSIYIFVENIIYIIIFRNKNNNEKRRRELGNEYMEQLGDLLQINLKEMSSCKPDKAAILKEARDTVSMTI